MTMRSALVPIGVMSLACAGGSGGGGADTSDTGTGAAVSQDVRGIYDLTWKDTFLITLDIGGAVQSATVSSGEVVTFNGPDGTPLELDIDAYCADPSVNCPSEAFPASVAIDQDYPDVSMTYHTLRASDAAGSGSVVSGLVDQSNKAFLFALDGASGGSGNCGALAVSLAGGTFDYDEAEAETAGGGVRPSGIIDGRVAVGWLGICAWEGLAVAATLSIETPYTGVRVSDL